MGRVKPPGRLGELASIRAEGKREIFDPVPLMKEQAMRRAAMPNPDRKPDVVHPSEMAKADWCIRATTMRILGDPMTPPDFNWTLEGIFEEGNSTHTWFQGLLADTGELFGSWQCTICERWEHNVLSEDLDRIKHCAYFMGDDGKSRGVLHNWEYKEVRLDSGIIAGKSDGGIRDTLMEFKTVGMGTVRIEAPKTIKKYYIQEHGLYNLDAFWKDLKRPFPGHIRQGNVYLWLAHQMGLTQFERMTYVYRFKANQQTKKFSVAYSEDIMAPLLAQVEKIKLALGRGQPPACEFGGCEQCNPGKEGAKNAEREKADQPDRPSRRVVPRSSRGADEARSGDSSETAGRRTTRAARRANRTAGSRADEPVQRSQSLERPPRLSTERGPGRRTVRRTPRREADRSGADTE